MRRFDVLLDELAELTGQRNAIDGRIVDIVAQIDRDAAWGHTGVRSVSALVAWKTGVTPRRAQTLLTVAQRAAEFPQCTAALREGRVSLDQIGVIAEHAADGSDAHYADLVSTATVSQLRTAVKQEPRPEREPEPWWAAPKRSITKTDEDDFTSWRIRLPHTEAAVFGTALKAHLDALVTDWKHDHGDSDTHTGQTPPMPTTVDAFMSLIEAGWDTEVQRRPHSQRSTVVAHLDIDAQIAALHLGPLLSDADRRYLLCDATCEVWFERHGRPIGAGRATRTVNRRLRRALEHRDTCCVVPGCGATRGLHAHHLVHWEDGGPTELWNLVLLCPFHHRLHHNGGITITGPADTLVVTDEDGRTLTGASLARPPTTEPPNVPPCPGPLGERAQWKWYTPYEPKPPPTN